jgi:hypothetical protein
VVPAKPGGVQTLNEAFFANPVRVQALKTAVVTSYLNQTQAAMKRDAEQFKQYGLEVRNGAVIPIEQLRANTNFGANTDSANTTTSFLTAAITAKSERWNANIGIANQAISLYTTQIDAVAKQAGARYSVLLPEEQKALPPDSEYVALQSQAIAFQRLAASSAPETRKKGVQGVIDTYGKLATLQLKKAEVYSTALAQRNDLGVVADGLLQSREQALAAATAQLTNGNNAAQQYATLQVNITSLQTAQQNLQTAQRNLAVTTTGTDPKTRQRSVSGRSLDIANYNQALSEAAAKAKNFRVQTASDPSNWDYVRIEPNNPQNLKGYWQLKQSYVDRVIAPLSDGAVSANELNAITTLDGNGRRVPIRLNQTLSPFGPDVRNGPEYQQR